jgi:hypothetical protein
VDLEEFARTELRALLQFSRVLAGERGLAEDIVQEVLMRLHTRADRPAELDVGVGAATLTLFGDYSRAELIKTVRSITMASNVLDQSTRRDALAGMAQRPDR